MQRYPVGSPVEPVAQPAGHRRLSPLVLFIAFCALVTAVGMVLVADDAGAAASPLRLGPELATEHVVPTPMTRVSAHADDIDGDGIQEVIVLSADGVAQLYARDGTFRWSTDTQAVADRLGLRSEFAGQFMAEYTFLRPEIASETGYTVLDYDGDGVRDIAATLYLTIDEPLDRYASVLVVLDGRDGSLLHVQQHLGILHHVLAADFDADGRDDLLLIEEDGNIEQLDGGPRGAGGRTTVWAQTVDGVRLWTYDTGRDWGLVHGLALGDFDGDGPDVVLTLTAALGRPVALDQLTTHGAQDLIALDGRTGAVLWSAPTIDYVRDLRVGDVNADLVDDVVLRVHESDSVANTRADGRSHVEARSGIDGSLLWSLQGLLGDHPEVHDIALLHGATTEVAIAYTRAPNLLTEQDALLRVVGGPSGSLVAELPVARTVLPHVAASPDMPPLAPQPLSAGAFVDWMHLVAIDADGDGDDDAVVGTPRGTAGFHRAAGTISAAWTDRLPTDRSLMFAVDGALGPEVWTQGWIETTSMHLYVAASSIDERFALARFYGYDAETGARLRDKPLLGQAMALTRADIDGDGASDRIIGGVSGAVFAFRGSSQDLLWQRDFGNYILDLYPEHIDDDGVPDLLVHSHLELGAMSGATGEILWRYVLATRSGAGEIRDLLLTDLDGDDVRDVVIAYRSGKNGGTSFLETPRVVAVSGALGTEVWTHPVPPPVTAVNTIAAGDINGDGVADIAVVFATNFAAHFGLGMIDGVTGLPVWRVDDRVTGGQVAHTYRSVEMLDSDDDGDLDVVVLTHGSPLSLRVHDGPTGATLSRTTFGSDLTLPFPVQMQQGPIGPDGSNALLVATRAGAGDAVVRLQAWSPAIAPLWQYDLVGQPTLFDIDLGDLDGDGRVDVVVGAPHGMAALDGASLASGTPSALGHVTRWSATKLAVSDVDDDGKAEIEFLVDPQNWPVQLGPGMLTDIGRGKAVGLIDMTPVLPPPPPPVANVLPVASIVLETPQPIYAGTAVTLRSTSHDPDGFIVLERWTLPDGSTVDGPLITHTFDAEGAYAVRLTVTDNRSATATRVQVVNVLTTSDHALRQSSSGTWTSPGGIESYLVTLRNVGQSTDAYTLSVEKPAGWDVLLSDSPYVTLPPGGERTWTVTVAAHTARPHGDIVVSVVSDGTGVTRSVSHRVVLPLVVDAVLDDGSGPYAPVTDITGHVQLKWLDGTPLGTTGLRYLLLGPSSAEWEGTSDPGGAATFTVPKTMGAAHQPGTYSLKVQPLVDGYTTFRTLPFHVGLPV